MGRRRRPAPAEFKELRGRIDDWRANRTGRNMPAEFWQAAAELARVHGVSPVSQALGVNYTRLKGHVEAGVVDTVGPEPISAPKFVEVQAKPPPAGLKEPEYVLELEAPESGTMRIRLKGVSTDVVADLAAVLWRWRR